MFIRQPIARPVFRWPKSYWSPVAGGRRRFTMRRLLKLALDALISEWRRTDELRAMGVEPSRSCLFYGPPGTGKTLTAFTLAGKLGLPVVNARIDGLVSSFLGTTARNVANLFDFANRYRCVLVLDEFDALAKMRDDPHELGEIKRVVNTLLQNLEGLGLTLAITNHDGLLDPAPCCRGSAWTPRQCRATVPGGRAQFRRSGALVGPSLDFSYPYYAKACGGACKRDSRGDEK
jgi:hypothetical protein